MKMVRAGQNGDDLVSGALGGLWPLTISNKPPTAEAAGGIGHAAAISFCGNMARRDLVSSSALNVCFVFISKAR